VILTEEELRRLGEAWGRQVERPVFIALRGELGAGKSVLARAIARGAGVEGTLPSPTFNLRFEYPASSGGRVIHMDLYRLHDPDEVWELGWEELGRSGEIVLVEWPERGGPYLPDARWDVHLSAVPGDPLRRELRRFRRGGAPPLPVVPGVDEGVTGGSVR
jgi:tRNA threonylcarbamoyladenosine biosynthesis protein TsaE